MGARRENKPENQPIARAVLIDPGRTDGLAALLEQYSVAMLPVGTKPLIQHWMERLAEAGVRDVLVLLAHMPEQTREFIGDGARWGIRVKTALVREGVSRKKQMAHTREFIQERTFVADVNMLPADGFELWFKEASKAHDGLLVGLPEKSQTLWQLVDQEFFGKSKNGESIIVETPPCQKDTYVAIQNPKQLWQANMDALDGTISDPHPAGFECSAGVFTSRNTHMHKSSALKGPCTIGENCMIGERVQIGPRAAVGSYVIADEGCKITNSVVFDHTFIGSHTELDQVIAARSLLYKVDTGVTAHVNDSAILSDVGRVSDTRVSLFQRLTAFILLCALGLPLLIRAVLLRLSGKNAWRRETLYVESGRDLSGAQDFRKVSVCSLNVKHPAWRKLPWLQHVVKGELCLTGSTPRHNQDAHVPEWASDAVTLPAGVITLADVTGAGKAGQDSEEIYIADSYYQATGGGGLDLALIWRWFLLLWKPC